MSRTVEPDGLHRRRGSPLAFAGRLLELAALIAAVVYALIFIVRQCEHFADPWFIEYDARGTTLPAWRYHGTGLFPNDLTVDYMNKMYFTLGCRVLFWIGTLFTTPIEVARVLPFLAFGVVLWQGVAFSHKRLGNWGVAVTIFLIVHSYCIWFRLLGLNSRAFGYPLTFAFIRYVADRKERQTLLTLLAGALCYPAALLLLWPAYVLVLLAGHTEFQVWKRAAVATVILGGVLAIPMARVDPRIGRPPSYAQAATLRQMRPGGAQPFYPLPSAGPSIEFTWDLAFNPAGQPVLPKLQVWAQTHAHDLELDLLVVLACLAATRLRFIPTVLPALVVAGLAMFVVISAVAYRLYLPDRPLTFAFPAVLACGLPLLAHQAFRSFAGTSVARPMAAAVICAFKLVLGGDGLARAAGGWGAYHTPVYDYFATLPKDVLVAGHPTTSQLIQTFAQRQTLFSDVTNTTFYYEYALEMDRRMDDYFRAYYSRDWEDLRRFSRRWGVDFLYVHVDDFGPSALVRASHTEPWGSLARSLILSSDARPLVLSNVPARAVVFRSGGELVVDLHRL